MSTSLLARCNFPRPGSVVTCALSGGPDSTALVALAVDAGCIVTAVHVNHGLRVESDDEMDAARAIAATLAVGFRTISIDVGDGPNLEARARHARRSVLGPDVLTGHTADDQAETVLLALLRGSGATGLAAMRPAPTKPILRLRRDDTLAVCAERGITPVHDHSNVDRRHRRNRVRHEIGPLLDDVAERDVTPLLTRTADLLRADDDLLDSLSQALDPTDAGALRDAPVPLARRAIRRWLTVDGLPPDAAAIERVLEVARGESIACEPGGHRRVERSAQRLRLFSTAPPDR